MLGGVLVDRFGGFCDLMIGVCLSGGAVATVFVPWAPIVQLMWFIIVVQGTFEGVINIAGQKLILNMWKEDAASPLHILHGGFGIGSFIIPLIATPFLAIPKHRPSFQNISTMSIYNISGSSNPEPEAEPESAPEMIKDLLRIGVNNSMLSGNMTDLNETNSNYEIEYLRESRIEYAYLISAIITMAMSIVFYVYHTKDVKLRKSTRRLDNHRKNPDVRKRSIKEMVNPASCAGGRFLYGTEIFIFLFIYFINIVGGERILGKFIWAFAIEQRGFSVEDGSYLNTAFWISFAIGRFVGFLNARWIPIRKLILLETGGVFVTSILMCIFAADNSTALWVLTQPLGFFHAPCFPSGIGWGDHHIEMTGMAITFLLLGGSLGGIAYLKLTGFLFEKFGPRAFLYHIAGYGILAFGLAIILNLIGSQHGNRFKEGKNDPVELQDMQEKSGVSDKEVNSKLLKYVENKHSEY